MTQKNLSTSWEDEKIYIPKSIRLLIEHRLGLFRLVIHWFIKEMRHFHNYA